eukprot:ANDGO_05506.mRNA.1 hypothetical protein
MTGTEDSVFEEYVSKVGEFMELQESLSAMLKAGWFDLAKARKTMGYTRVSTELVPKEIMPTKLISVEKHGSNGSVEFRIVANKRLEEPVQIHDPEDAESELDVRRLSKNPLQWFGVLVNPDLRSCETQFSHALQVVCRIASLRVEIHKLYKLLDSKDHL